MTYTFAGALLCMLSMAISAAAFASHATLFALASLPFGIAAVVLAALGVRNGP